MDSASKAWFCFSLDLVILCHRPTTKCVNRSLPLNPSCESGILCPDWKEDQRSFTVFFLLEWKAFTPGKAEIQ